MKSAPRTALKNTADFCLGVLEYYTSSQRIYRYRSARIKREQASFSTQRPAEPIAEITIEELTPGELRKRSHNFQKPIVIRRALQGSQAVERWSCDYLTNKCGDGVYEVVIANDDRFDNRDVAFERIPFSELTEQMRAQKSNVALELCSEIFVDYPELTAELGAHRLMEKLGIGEQLEYSVFQLFMQAKGALTDMHTASGGNLFLNVKGTKTWIFVDPRYTHLLHARPKPVIESWLKPFFHLDCVESFGRKDPFLENIPRTMVTLEDGDVLFNPPWWWHAVFSEAEENIAVASRVAPKWWDFRLHRDPSITNNPGYALLSVYLPVRCYVAARQLSSLVRRRRTQSSEKIMAELFNP